MPQWPGNTRTIPAAAETVQPLQAAPAFFGWLAKFEPMHQVFLGARALLYLDGRANAGLSQSLELTAIGLVIGLLLGGIVTRIYDRRGYHRLPPGLVAAASSQTAATTGLVTGPTNTPETTVTTTEATYPEE